MHKCLIESSHERVKRKMASGRLLLATGIFCAFWAFHATRKTRTVSELYLDCICETVSNCNKSAGCEGDVCGLFKITPPYWIDAGKPVINGDNKDQDGAFVRCVHDPYCAASTVQGYMAKLGKDCNGDGVVNCFDYAKIHRLGGYGCEGNLDYNYQNRLMECLQKVQELTGIHL